MSKHSITMTPLLAELAQALREREAAIGDREHAQRDPAGHLERLKTVSEDIVRIGGSLPPPIHPELAHYLERCSYQKALALIESAAGPE